MQPHDRIRLQHMRDAARDARSFAAGRSRDDLATNRMLVLALVKSIEIIGEAASRVSAEARTEVPNIPSQQSCQCATVSFMLTST